MPIASAVPTHARFPQTWENRAQVLPDLLVLDLVVARNLVDTQQASGIAFPFAALHHARVCQKRRGLGEEHAQRA